MAPGKSFSIQPRQKGFTLIAALAAMFLLALATQKVMGVVSQQTQREREAELLLVGAAYTRAIGDYYESSPGSIKRWPQSLGDLTDDKRFVVLRRHLRQAYVDPIAPGMEWGLVTAPDGGIMGVYSRSELMPIRSAAQNVGPLQLAAASHYTDWQFVYTPSSSRTTGKP